MQNKVGPIYRLLENQENITWDNHPSYIFLDSNKQKIGPALFCTKSNIIACQLLFTSSDLLLHWQLLMQCNFPPESGLVVVDYSFQLI